MIEELERALNHASDMDHEWGPLLFLRPERYERMSSRRVATLSVLYGALAGVIVNVLVRFTGEHARALHPLLFPCAITLGFFMFYRFTFAACWNRRAERMARGARD
ncbi:MAG TPA: hypothetical protein VGI39_37690 [Polyangiaceae bacterium]|jgi:hypothetical protein